MFSKCLLRHDVVISDYLGCLTCVHFMCESVGTKVLLSLFVLYTLNEQERLFYFK